MPVHADLLTALGATLPRADMQDWQLLAALQKTWQEIADAAEAEGAAEVSALAVAAGQSLDALFCDDLTAARAEQARADLVSKFAAACALAGVRDAGSQAQASGTAPKPAAAPATAAPAAAHVVDELGEVVVLGPQAESAMLAEFATEVGEHLQAIEANLLAIEAGGDAEAVNACFRAFHTVKGLAGFMGLTREQRLAHAAENLLDQVRARRVEASRVVMDLLLQSRDMLVQFVTACGGAGPGVALPAEPRLPPLIAALNDAAEGKSVRVPSVGELLVETGKITRAQLEGALIRQAEDHPDRKLGELLVEDGHVAPGDVQHALDKQKQVRQVVGNAAASAAPASMRVEVGTVDALADTIGELVIATNMLLHAEELKSLGNRRVTGLIGQLDRVTRSVQGMAQRLRLVSLKPVFQRMTRLVRDLERKTGKQVELVLQGEDVDLDKAVVDRLADPMVHLVRNALDHGLEDPATRVASGKPAAGRLRLAAERRAGAIHIIIEEDGRGMNRERIVNKAVEKGLIKSGTELSDSEVWDLIYLPGFSTAEKVTDLSGRGVGMDVVRRMVSESRGRIITESRPGHGTTFTLVLPLTLAIIDGMIVKAGDQHFIVPTLAVVLAVRLDDSTVTEVQGGRGRLMDLHGRQIPLFSLSALLRVPPSHRQRELVVVVNDGAREFGLIVDAVIGRQQVVLKALGRGLPSAPGVSGATITGDGLVCLVLDIAGLIDLTHHHSAPPNVPAQVSA